MKWRVVYGATKNPVNGQFSVPSYPVAPDAGTTEQEARNSRSDRLISSLLRTRSLRQQLFVSLRQQSRMRTFHPSKIERLLARFGFVLVSQSHRKWRNYSTGRQVIVPFHSGRNLPVGTLRNILENAAIPESEWKN